MKKIHLAATVVLLRITDEPLQVFLLRRHGGHEFMANRWVFPGGRLDDADGDLRITALRETFEESGLLLARRPDEDHYLDLRDPRLADQFQALRHQVDQGALTLPQLLHQQNLEPAVEDLHFFAHWITPDFESRRYDTRFFAARAPAHQAATHDDGETTQGQWWTPTDAINAYRDGQILLAPPTLRVLEELAQITTPKAFFDDLQQRPAPPTILPHPLQLESGEVALALPGDPDYPDEHAELDHIEPVRDGVTRMILRDGQWFSQRS